MVSLHSVQGFERVLFLSRLKAAILLHFLPLVTGSRRARARLQNHPVQASGNEVGPPRLSPRRFYMFIRRLLLFLSKLDHNKFMGVDGKVRMDLYVPSFPGPAFYSGCRKFLEFEDLPPCVTVLVSVTSACRFSCEHCYQRFDNGRDVPIDKLVEVVRRLQAQGIAFFNIEGGEPFLVFDRLRAVCSAIDSRSEVWRQFDGRWDDSGATQGA